MANVAVLSWADGWWAGAGRRAGGQVVRGVRGEATKDLKYLVLVQSVPTFPLSHHAHAFAPDGLKVSRSHGLLVGLVVRFTMF